MLGSHVYVREYLTGDVKRRHLGVQVSTMDHQPYFALAEAVPERQRPSPISRPLPTKTKTPLGPRLSLSEPSARRSGDTVRDRQSYGYVSGAKRKGEMCK